MKYPAAVYQVTPRLWRAECPWVAGAVTHAASKQDAVRLLLEFIGGFHTAGPNVNVPLTTEFINIDVSVDEARKVVVKQV